jgi:SAM-dependent methyltransferase
MLTAQGRSRLWTQCVHRKEVHQTTSYTSRERYPALFDSVSRLAPGARRILSFGCSTGDELVALRRRFSAAEIVGAEINPRSRRIAATRMASDLKTIVIPPNEISGCFDLIFALAVFQREPHKVEEIGLTDLSSFYPFDRFDAGVSALVRRLRPRGFLCVINSQYRVEDSTAAALLEPVQSSPQASGPFFDRHGRRATGVVSRTVFQRLPDRQ